ncbi:MAG: DDE-type integrase/transposase/recombinase [Salinivirgaceae bacterium]|nr:DDE-type integrase/transposase/recombinase [Salinivirgaceae bacterium]MDY0280910.1 DDE-type integrase/transposase/recombinase [Salinivirgaceae bacterium]
MRRDKALAISGLSKHKYYYKPSKNKRGRKPTETTFLIQGSDVERVDNSVVIEEIKEIQRDPDTDYGHRKMTYALLLLGFIINHKKVYRLMKQHQQLKQKNRRHTREFVKYRKVLPSKPLEVLEMDIKFVWVEEHRMNAFILTVIDTFTRVVLGRKTAYSLKQNAIKELWTEIIENHLQPNDCLKKTLNIEIRNDNDSRFIAKSVQKFFAENKLHQVFTHPYTPQENGHIESFHAILSERLNRITFWSLDDLEQCLILFYEKYNLHRIHSSTAYLPPMVFWECWENGEIETRVDVRKKQIRHKLLRPYHELSGKMSPREVPCHPFQSPKGFELNEKNEMYGAETFLQPSV